MLKFKELTEEKLRDLFSISYNRAINAVDPIIEELIQRNSGFGFSREEAIIDILSDYRKQAKNDDSTIIEFLGKYRTLCNDFFTDNPEFEGADYSEKCISFLASHLFQLRNDFVIKEFDNESEIIEYFERKILCYEIIIRVKLDEILTTEIRKEESIIVESNKDAIKGMFKFNRNNEDYLYEYLEELKSVFDFLKISDINFNAICSAIYEKEIFKKGIPFSTVVKTIASYYHIKPPKESKPNSCRQRKKELLQKYSILERELTF